MAEYIELVKALREHKCDAKDEDDTSVCAFCAYEVAIDNRWVCVCGLLNKAADAIEELQGEIDAWVEPERKALIKSLPRWHPVTERLPEEDKLVLVWRDNGLPYVSRRIDSTYWVGLGRDAGVTHWMPLPEPPKEEN